MARLDAQVALGASMVVAAVVVVVVVARGEQLRVCRAVNLATGYDINMTSCVSF